MVDLYVNLSQFLLLPGSGTTFPEVDPDKWSWSGSGSGSATLVEIIDKHDSCTKKSNTKKISHF